MGAGSGSSAVPWRIGGIDWPDDPPGKVTASAGSTRWRPSHLAGVLCTVYLRPLL